MRAWLARVKYIANGLHEVQLWQCVSAGLLLLLFLLQFLLEPMLLLLLLELLLHLMHLLLL